jgi:hypothetical protein
MSRYDEDEKPTNPGSHRRVMRSVGELEELVGQLMADQISLRKDLNDVSYACQSNKDECLQLRKKSLRPPAIIDNGKLTIIITATTVIVTSIVTALKMLGVVK